MIPLEGRGLQMEALPLESVLLILRDSLHTQEGQRPSEILFNTSIRDVKRELFQQFASVSRSALFQALVPIPEYAHVKGGAALEIMGIIPYFSSPDVDVQVLAPEDGEALMNKIAAALPRVDGFPGFGFEVAALSPTEPIADEVDFREVEHYRVSHIRSKDYEKVTVSVKLGEFQDAIFDFALPDAVAAAQLPAPHTISPFPLPILVEQNLQSLINRFGFVYGSEVKDPGSGRTRFLNGYEAKYEFLLVDWASAVNEEYIRSTMEREKNLRQKLGLNFTKLKNHMERLMLLFENATTADTPYLVDLFRKYLITLELQSVQLPAHDFLVRFVERLLGISSRYGLVEETHGIQALFEMNLENWNTQRTPYKKLFTADVFQRILDVVAKIQGSTEGKEDEKKTEVGAEGEEVLAAQERSASPTESQEDEELVKQLELIAKLQEDEAWQLPKTTAPLTREKERQEEIKYFKTSITNRRKAIEEAEKERKQREKEEREQKRKRKEEAEKKKRETEKLKALEERALLEMAAEEPDVSVAYYLCVEPDVVEETYVDDMMTVLTSEYTSRNPKLPQGNIFYTIRAFDVPDLPFTPRETIHVNFEHPAFVIVFEMVKHVFAQATNRREPIFKRLQESFLRLVTDILALLIAAIPQKKQKLIELGESAKLYLPEEGKPINLEKVHSGFWSIYMSVLDIALQATLEDSQDYASVSDEPVRYSKVELFKIIRPLLDSVVRVKGPLQIELKITQEELVLVAANLFQLCMNVRSAVTIRTMKHLKENSELGAEASGGEAVPTVYFIPTPSLFPPDVIMVYLRQLQEAGIYYIREPLHFTKLFYEKYPALKQVFEKMMMLSPGLEYMVLEVMMWKSMPIWMEPKNGSIISIFVQFLLRIFTGSTSKIGSILCINSEDSWRTIEQVLLTFTQKQEAIQFANTYMEDIRPKIQERRARKKRQAVDMRVLERKAIREVVEEALHPAAGAAATVAAPEEAEAPGNDNSFATIHAGHTPKTPGKGKPQKGKKTRGGGKKGVKVDARRATQKKRSKPQ